MPAPGDVLDGATGAPAKISANEPAADQAAQVAVDYEVVPGSLPRLRFGRTYAMRARCVDLAGNSQPLRRRRARTPPPPPETFGRLEPVAAPVVVRRSPRPVPGVGDTPVGAGAAQRLSTYADNEVGPGRPAAVPRPGRPGPVRAARASGRWGDPGSYAELAARDALDLDRPDGDGSGVRRVAGARWPDRPGATRQDGRLPVRPGDRRRPPRSRRGDEVTVDLADTWPAAGDGPAGRRGRRGRARGRSRTPTPTYACSWPRRRSSDWSRASRIADELLDHFALWQRLTVEEQDQLAGADRRRRALDVHPGPAADPGARRTPPAAGAVGGRSWTAIGRWGPRPSCWTARWSRSTTSTERVTHDRDLDRPGRRPRPGRPGAAVDQRGAGQPAGRRGSDKNEMAIEALRAELHDTKRHLATVDLEAYSSFAAYFTEEKSLTVPASRVLLDGRGVVAGSVEVTVTATGVKAEPGADFTVDGLGRDPAAQPARGPGGRRGADRALHPAADQPGEHASRVAKAFSMLLPNTAVPPPPVGRRGDPVVRPGRRRNPVRVRCCGSTWPGRGWSPGRASSWPWSSTADGIDRIGGRAGPDHDRDRARPDPDRRRLPPGDVGGHRRSSHGGRPTR